MEDVGLDQFEFGDWEAPGEQPRPPARLFLPGNECVYEIVGYEPGRVITPAAPPPTAAPAPPAEPAPPQGFGPGPVPGAPPETPPPTTQPPATTAAPRPAPVQTSPPRPIYAPVETGTTIAPDVLDPNAPLPSLPLQDNVRPC